MKHSLQHIFINVFSILSVSLILSASVFAQDVVRPEPEMATVTGTATNAVSDVKGEEFMAVTANPHATRAAADILAQGGNAVDAAIAAQLVLGLVEPQSSGLGGGAFVVYFDAQSDKITSFDARETAPAAAYPSMFLQEDGTPLPFEQVVHSGGSVGVPGVPALLSHLYKTYGSMKKGEPFAAAMTLAENGFEISPRLAQMIAQDAEWLGSNENAAAYFLNADGTPKQAGDVLKNPQYAQTLKTFKNWGDKWFYNDASKGMAALIRSHGGIMTAEDFAAYSVIERKPVCAPYRIYIVCSMDEPSSGGLTILAALGMLERFDLSDGPTAENVHLIVEASRLAFADRNKYMADPAFVISPGRNLIEPRYLAARSARIRPSKAMTHVRAGMIDAESGTSHISIVDAKGNVLSMTTTIEGAFGSKIMTEGGFLLNNEMTDFSFMPTDEDGNKIANSIEPGKRPRSSMAPVIIFDAEGQPFMTLGSAGGSRIIGFVLQRIIAAIDWKMTLDQSIAMPHFLARSDMVELEEARLAPQLKAFGHKVKVDEMSSGLTAIQWGQDQRGKRVMYGVADPRREGVAAGR